MPTVEALNARLLALRQGFDRAFSEPVADAVVETLEVLDIRVGREHFALRVSEIAALEADRTITAVPSDHPELLGIAGVRGSVVAVFDLAALLDLPRVDASRWLVLAKGAPLALAFSEFIGQRALTPDAVARAAADQAGRVRELIRQDGAAVPLIHVPALVADLEKRSRRTHPGAD
jgi:chemotaxis signal transduction protein